MVRQSITVQQYSARDGYAKGIGKHLGRDGKPKPKVWYFLGVDRREACRRAEWLKTEWRRLKALGHSTWPEGFEDAVPWRAAPQAVVPAQPTPWHGTATAATPASGKPQSAAPTHRAVRVGQASIKDAYDLFRAEKKAAAERGEVSLSRVAHIRHFLQRTLERLGSDTPLVSVDGPTLEALTSHFRSRPPKTLQDGSQGDPISIDYARSLIGTAGTFFRWVAAKGRLGWTLPEGFEEMFDLKARPIKPKTEAEKKRAYHVKRGSGVKVIDVPTLRKLYHAADETTRAWILLALNAAFRQQDISECRAYYVKQQGRAWFLDYDRSKTGEPGSCKLWAETVKAIEATRSAPNKEERIWLRPDGKTLVVQTTSSRNDFIRRRWNLARAVVGTKATFDQLRDTSATMILQLSGSRVIQEAHTAHAEEEKMAQHYANRFWDDVHQWQDAMRNEFKPVWS